MKIIVTIEDDYKEEVSVELRNPQEEKKRIFMDSVSMYARFFDDACVGWNKDAEANLIYLRHQQSYANEKLKHMGYLFLNEVYDMLGTARTKEGQVVGWVYNEENPIGDNRVDFDLYNERNRDFIEGYVNTVLLDFNVDGNILDRI